MTDLVSPEDAAALDRKLTVAIEAGDRLIALALERQDPGERRAFVEESKALLVPYLFPPS